MAERRIAVCDLGSNSFRLVVFTAAEGWWRRTDEIHEPVRIGAGLAETGTSERAGHRARPGDAEVFAHFCSATGITEIDAVATSAIRDATNAEDFLDRAALPVRVLSREEEARMGYLAAVNSTTLADGAVLDLGGGSMQLVRDRLAPRRRAAVLAAGRGADDRALRPRRGRGEQEAAQGAARARRRPSWRTRRGCRAAASGSSASAARCATSPPRSSEPPGVPELGVQGFVVEREALAELVARLAALTPTERAKVPGIKYARADLILAGAVVVESVLELGDFPALEVTEAGLREGVFFARHLDGDPPLFDDVRRSSVLNLAAQYHVDHAHTEHVSKLALGLFDDFAAAGLHPGDARERELLWAACVLHDIGMSVDYDDHHKHSRYLVLNSGLPGFDQREVAIIGQAVRFHRKGMPTSGGFEGAAAQRRRGDPRPLRAAAAPRRGPGAQPRPARADGQGALRERRGAAQAAGRW